MNVAGRFLFVFLFVIAIALPADLLAQPVDESVLTHWFFPYSHADTWFDVTDWVPAGTVAGSSRNMGSMFLRFDGEYRDMFRPAGLEARGASYQKLGGMTLGTFGPGPYPLYLAVSGLTRTLNYQDDGNTEEYEPKLKYGNRENSIGVKAYYARQRWSIHSFLRTYEFRPADGEAAAQWRMQDRWTVGAAMGYRSSLYQTSASYHDEFAAIDVQQSQFRTKGWVLYRDAGVQSLLQVYNNAAVDADRWQDRPTLVMQMNSNGLDWSFDTRRESISPFFRVRLESMQSDGEGRANGADVGEPDLFQFADIRRFDWTYGGFTAGIRRFSSSGVPVDVLEIEYAQVDLEAVGTIDSWPFTPGWGPQIGGSRQQFSNRIETDLLSLHAGHTFAPSRIVSFPVDLRFVRVRPNGYSNDLGYNPDYFWPLRNFHAEQDIRSATLANLQLGLNLETGPFSFRYQYAQWIPMKVHKKAIFGEDEFLQKVEIGHAYGGGTHRVTIEWRFRFKQFQGTQIP